MRLPLLAFLVLAMAVGVVGARAWVGAGDTAHQELIDRGAGVADVLGAALRASRDRGRQAEERERLRLATAARRIRSELARAAGPAQPRLERLVTEEHLGRVFLFDARGARGLRVTPTQGWLLIQGDAGTTPAEGDPRAEAEWRRAAQAVGPLLAGQRDLVTTGASPNVFGTTYRIGVGVRLEDGGAVWVEGDAEDVVALERGADLGAVLKDACGLPDVRSVRVARGEEVVAEACGAAEAQAGQALSFPRPLALEGEPTLAVTLELSTARADALAAAERRGILLWIALAGGAALLGAGFLWRRARLALRQERRRSAELSQQHRLAEMGMLSGLFVHEISNPLNALALQLAALQRTLGDAGSEPVGRLRRTLGRARTALEGFLRVGTPIEPVVGPTFGLPTLRRALADLQAEARDASLRLEVEPGAEALHAAARDAVLDHAVRSVLRNALEVSPPGGVVSVHWGGAAGGRVMLSVADQGPGFSPALLSEGPALGRTSREGGHGLGLYLARRAVEAAGGRLTLSNRAEGGAQVVLDLAGAAIEGAR